jgi:predicted RNA binding protein YcfA (HicA-like mRNA interferase family)
VINIPALTPQKLERIVLKMGFVLKRTKGSHRIYYGSTDKKRIVIPFHKKDLPKGTTREILKQAGIKKEDIEELL